MTVSISISFDPTSREQRSVLRTLLLSLVHGAATLPDSRGSVIKVDCRVPDLPIEVLALSVSTANFLRRGGLETIGQIMTYSEKNLYKFRGCGELNMRELETMLAPFGITLDEEGQWGFEC